MKDKAAIVIAVLMITSIAYALSTTSVGASPGSATISPDKTGANKWVLLTFSITNETGYEIYRILIRDEPENDWADPIGGHWSTCSIKENWENVADNLSAAGTMLPQVSDNLEEALTAKQSVGTELKLAADNLEDAGEKMNISARENAVDAGYAIDQSAEDLAEVATLLQQEPENLVLVAAWIENAAGTGQLSDNLKRAADNLTGDTNANLSQAGTHIGNAADNLANAATQLKGGIPWLAGDYIENAAVDLNLAGENLQAYTGGGASLINDAGDLIVNNVKPKLDLVATYLKRMADNLEEAGTALSTIRTTYFNNAQTIPMDNNPANTLDYLGSAFLSAIENTENALIGRGAQNYENIILAGEGLENAGKALSAVQDSTMVEFGSRYLGTRSDSVDNMLYKAGDNLADRERLNITTAVSAIDNAASMLSSAAAKLKATAAELEPTNWALTGPVNGDVALEAENREYQIAVGGSETFKFLWKAPDVGKTYTFKLYYYDNTWPTAGEGAYRGYDTVTIEVDKTCPKVVTFKVTQTGGVENVVGTVRDNGKATITLVASEALSELNTMYIENTAQDNKLPPISMSDWTTDDNITFTYEFTVGAWDDNTMRVRIKAPWATDEYLNENSGEATDNFIVDTRKPVFVDNGLDELETLLWKHQAGTGTRYRTDNDAEQTINGIVQDNDWWCNYAGTKRYGYDNQNTVVIPSIVIEYDTNIENAEWLPAENFYKKVDLSEGLNSVVRITATDWAGNSENVYIENIFIDTTPPTIVFNTISGATWDENGEMINDNTPEIKVTITDPGYPTSGLGVAYKVGSGLDENFLYVCLDNNENIWDGLLGGAYVKLENKDAWDPSTGVFENLIDNAGKGLVDGTYWINVWASDNFTHNGENGKVASQSFTIDTSVPTWTTSTAQAAITFYYAETMATIPTTTKKDTWYIEGTAQKAKSTMYIYAPDNVTVAGSVLAGTDRSFSLSVTLSEGINKVYIEEVDQANNSSGRVLYGTYTVDKTPPVITLSEPTTGISTGEAQITVSGTVIDALVAYDQLTVEIDCTGAAVAKTVYLNADGSFSTTVPLVEGTNVINVVARDAAITTLAGNQTISTVTVTRTVTPVATYAIVIVIVALVLAAIAIFRKR